jgi:hypothetical protein
MGNNFTAIVPLYGLGPAYVVIVAVGKKKILYPYCR